MAYKGSSVEVRRYSPAVEVSSSIVSSTNYWIKIASFTTGETMQGGSCVLLVNMGGPEISGSYDRDDTYLIRAKYTPNSSSPYHYSDGTSVRVDQFNTVIADFDATTDAVMVVNSDLTADLWIKASAGYGRCYVTHLGGADRKDDGTYEAGEWVIPPPMAWASAFTTGDTSIFGGLCSKTFEDVLVVGEDPRVKIDGDTDSHPGLELYENGERKWIIFNDYTNDNLTFKTDSTVRMVIDDNGNVGIGTSPSSSSVRLDVAGGQTYLAADKHASPALNVSNDGDDQYRYGVTIQAGTDDGTCANGLRFNDGNGDQVGYISWSSGTVTYATFTGAHEGAVPSPDYTAGQDSYDYGTIVRVVSAVTGNKPKQVDYVIAPTSTAKDKSVIGVYSSNMDPDEVERVNNHQVFALGDGHILVCNEGGDVESGDFICSSDTQGHGMKQDDDLMHNYTVAKALESVVWAQESGTEKLVACTYHCG